MHDAERFPLHDKTTASPESAEMLVKAEANLSMVPNLERVMASAPALLAGYVTLWDLFDTASLSAIERQVVYQTANFENECRYCVPWHSMLAEKAGLPPEDVKALRDGTALSDPKLQALRRFTRAVLMDRGHVPDFEKQAFFEAGYGPQQALEVVLGLAVKTMSNYTNAIAGTPLDKPMHRRAWQRPRRGGAME